MITGLFSAAMWAGVIALDFTACGPFMLSQPLVCGPLFGWMMGNVAVGIIVGGIMQLLWMDLSPIGVGIPYDATASTILAVYWASLPGHGALSQVVLCMALAMPLGFVFRWLDQAARRLNTRVMRGLDQFSGPHLAWALRLGIVYGIAWSWVRYSVAYGICFFLGSLAWKRMGYVPRLTPLDQGLTLAVILLPVAGLGIALALFLSDDADMGSLTKRASGSSPRETL